jgi:hypothetical protein
MAKVTIEDRHLYFEKIKPYKAMIESLITREEKILLEIRKDNLGAALKRLALVEDMLSLAANFMIISGISQSMLKLRSEEALNDGRKSLYKAVIYFEEIVSPLVDAPFSDYEDRLAEIDAVDAQQRYNLIRKTGLTLQLLESAYGDNTKWRWTFVDLEGRFAAVAKNTMNLKTAVVNTDPSSPDYEPTMFHLRLIKKLLMQAADRYREKYELSTNRMDDFKMGINFLNALRRIHALLGERTDAEIVKKKAEIWSSKLETDQKKKEEAVSRKI